VRHISTWLAGLMTCALAVGSAALADEFTLDWRTVDGGGVIWTIGGNFELGGTIGQPDAGVMIGGTFELTGGFWAVPPCWCMSDINNDGHRDGLDVQGFIDCILATGLNCACADLNKNGVLDMNDMSAFVNGLLVGGECP
jgi:hypothetical protein